jgi:two-component system alkaline phosphatase synthesis response regulator PhoP
MPVIFVVEDDTNIRDIERYALKNSGYDVETFENGADFYEKLKTEVPALVLLDIMMPGENGLDILKRLRASPATRKIPVILVTAKSSELDKVRGLDLGADDYVTKPFGVMELVSRVKALLRRANAMQEDAQFTIGMISMDNERHTVQIGGEPCELTYKEFELLKYLMMNKGVVLSRDKLMNQVWGFEYEGESRTVDAHIKTLRRKLGDAGRYIKTIRNVGYVIEL